MIYEAYCKCRETWTVRAVGYKCPECRQLITLRPIPYDSGVVFGWDVPPSEGTEVDRRLQGIPKPATLPHEAKEIRTKYYGGLKDGPQEFLGETVATDPKVSSHSLHEYYVSTDGMLKCRYCKQPAFECGPKCPARNEPPAECDCAEQRARGFRQVCDICQGPIGNDPKPAEKAEALPEALKLWASWMEGTFVPQHIDHVARNVLLAEFRKIARKELSRARIQLEPITLGAITGIERSEWMDTDLRIVPGKEGES